MKPIGKTTSGVGLAIASFAAMMLLSCKNECIAGTGCGGPVTYDVSLQSAPANLGAVILSIQTADQSTVSVVSGRSLPAQLDGTGLRRGIIIGPVINGSIINIHFNSLPAGAPVVSVVDAAANQSGGYAVIPPSSLQLTVTAK
jgi:hypothetical protein